MEQQQREVGVVSSWKGSYGFIRPEAAARSERGSDVFVHFRDLRLMAEGDFRTLAIGQRVAFTRQTGDRGCRACDVVIVAESGR